MEVPVFFLAFSFGIHIIMVNIGIALATLIPYLEWKARKLSDNHLLSNTKTLFKIYAATYALAGVFGTAFTVFLLSYYPEFIGIAGHLTLFPFGIAILFIALHFLSIVAYWYGWDNFKPQTHLLVGAVLAFSSYMIPLGFRAVFAFLNLPVGLRFVDSTKPYLDLGEALLNPTFLPLYLKSIAGALTAGLLFVAGIYAYKRYKGELQDDEFAEEMIIKPAKTAFILLIVQIFLGLWYMHSLSQIPYKFNNIFAGLGIKVPGSEPTMNLGWLFILKTMLVAFQLVALAYVLYVSKDKLTNINIELVKLSALAALLTILFGEYLNAFSQYPYFVAALPHVADKIPEPWRTLLARALDLRKTNILAQDPALIMFTVVFLGALLVAATYFLYVVFFKKE